MKHLPITLDTKQLQAWYNMLDMSCIYYANACKQPNNMVDLCTDQLRYEALVTICNKAHRLNHQTLNAPIKQYTAKVEYTSLEALTILGSVIPPGNNTYNDDVKQIVIDYCIQVLKHAGVIPNMPTYTPQNVAPNQAIHK